MSATRTGKAPRQYVILAGVGGLHVAAFWVAASGLLPRLVETLPEWPIVFVPPPAPEAVDRPRPSAPVPGDYAPPVAPMPDIEMPSPAEAAPPRESGSDSGSVSDDTASAAPRSAFEPPALRTRDRRLAALIDACYPASSRRQGEEGRAVARVTLDEHGEVARWSLSQGSGFPRLDSALGCVIRKLQFDPARLDGHAVTAEAQLPISFRLD